MKWYGASQRRGTLSRLAPDGKDVKAVTLYTHTFFLIEDGRSDEQKQPHYTAVGATPEEAEAMAFAVYQRAMDCNHAMQQKGPMLIECSHCGIQRRVLLPPAPPVAVTRKAERRFFNLF
ncbi:MAG: hypothetical protein Q4C89_01305 [Deinococcus sp.]|uniref:hypothetical protein n=1 Tax=Deinococcus sp. TaxID=47478 RepID=UPI0026DBE942|nr:hypothetical protein [Deinococcus sp.]MDO4244646.1 hypothetical protein [Deinococcus sp.]